MYATSADGYMIPHKAILMVASLQAQRLKIFPKIGFARFVGSEKTNFQRLRNNRAVYRNKNGCPVLGISVLVLVGRDDSFM